MKKFVSKKKIVIKSKGPIRLKGNIQGPVEIPYYEKVETICNMIMDGLKVYEILNDNSEIKLTLSNYNVESNPEDPSMKNTFEPVNKKNVVVPSNPKPTTPKVVISRKSKADPYEEI